MASISVKKATEPEVRALGAKSWPIWTCEASTFDWHYDQKETCLILEGEVVVKAGSETASFGPGDLVVFPEGLDCVWQVVKPVRKHYKFG
ncbi:MAG: cupin domain-containing protein [Elusimicrobiota bacterium]|jgi:hypothetical protein